MDSTPDQVRGLFCESGYEPTQNTDDWEMSIKLPMVYGGVLTVSVMWDQGPDVVFVSTNGVTATHLPFVDFPDFAAMFRALLRGCVPGPALSDRSGEGANGEEQAGKETPAGP